MAISPSESVPTVEKIVRLNKFLLGSTHICTTVCERRGYHSGPNFLARRVGPFWNRRDEYSCVDCGQIVDVPLVYRAGLVVQP